MFEVGSLARTVYTHQIAVVLQQDNVASPAQTQIFVGGEKKWIHTRKLRRISGNKHEEKA
jgi:hypothetical protein